MKYILSHVDTCTTDYFRGSHLPVVQVMVDENTTYLDIKLELLSYQATEHLDLDSSKYIEAVNDLFSNFKSLNYVPDCLYEVGSIYDNPEWDLYMYFTVETDISDDLDAMDSLRDQGYAVVIFNPEELGNAIDYREKIEETMIACGWDCIDFWKGNNND